jgi:hypothetical protein
MTDMRHKHILLSLVFVLTILTLTCTAQYDSSAIIPHRKKQKNIFSIGMGAQYGFIFAHSPEVENTKGARPAGIEFNLSWQKYDAATWNLCNCFPRKGIVLAYYDYNTAILGKSYSAAYFLEPVYRLRKNTFFSFKAVAGLSYLTNPFDSIQNPTNRSYSTHLSGYLLVGLGLWFRLHDRWWLNTTINYQHESNGGLRQPNKGINWPTAGIAISYLRNPQPYYTGVRTKEKYWKDKPIRWDASLFGIAKRTLDANGNSRRRLLLGFNGQGSKQVGRINALTAGAEIFSDGALRMQLQLDSVNASAVRAGLLAGHEFLLGKFIFSQQLGVYVFNPTARFDQIYHRWGIQYLSNNYWGVGARLLAHRHVADFVDLRVIYSWHKK